MQVSHRHKIILIENPCCANLSAAALLRAERFEGIAPGSVPKKIRAVLPPGMWEEYEKMIVVRDVRSRFISAVAWALLPDSTLPAWLLPLRDCPDLPSAVTLAVELFEGKAESDPLPIMFRPQVAWLASKLDTVVALQDLPVFANRRQFGTSLTRTNVRVPRPPRLPMTLLERIDALYPADIAKFAKMPVWSPKPGVIRLLSGNCAECAAKKNAQP